MVAEIFLSQQFCIPPQQSSFPTLMEASLLLHHFYVTSHGNPHRTFCFICEQKIHTRHLNHNQRWK